MLRALSNHFLGPDAALNFADVRLSQKELEKVSGGWIDPYQECMDKTYDDVYKCVDEFSINPYGGGSLQACYQAMYDAQDACNSLR